MAQLFFPFFFCEKKLKPYCGYLQVEQSWDCYFSPRFNSSAQIIPADWNNETVCLGRGCAPPHLASEPIYSPDHITSARINLLGLFFYCTHVHVYLYPCISAHFRVESGFMTRPGRRCIETFLLRDGLEVSWSGACRAHPSQRQGQFPGDLGFTEAAPLATVLWPQPFHQPAHLPALISLHWQPGAQPIALDRSLWVCVFY